MQATIAANNLQTTSLVKLSNLVQRVCRLLEIMSSSAKSFNSDFSLAYYIKYNTMSSRSVTTNWHTLCGRRCLRKHEIRNTQLHSVPALQPLPADLGVHGSISAASCKYH